MISLPVICTEMDFPHRESSHPRHFRHQDRRFGWGNATHLISKPLKSWMWLAMNLVGISLPILAGCVAMSTWSPGLLHSCSTQQLQICKALKEAVMLLYRRPTTNSQRSHTSTWGGGGGCIARKTLTRVSSHPTS